MNGRQRALSTRQMTVAGRLRTRPPPALTASRPSVHQHGSAAAAPRVTEHDSVPAAVRSPRAIAALPCCHTRLASVAQAGRSASEPDYRYPAPSLSHSSGAARRQSPASCRPRARRRTCRAPAHEVRADPGVRHVADELGVGWVAPTTSAHWCQAAGRRSLEEELEQRLVRAIALAQPHERADGAPLVGRVAVPRPCRSRRSANFAPVSLERAVAARPRQAAGSPPGASATVVDVASKSPSSAEPGM